MKKILFLAAAIVVGTALSANAAKKKKKEGGQKQPVPVVTASDSLSYANGMAQTQGLIPYLQQQYKVDTAYMADFVRGYEEALTKADDPQYVAYNAGIQIAQMVSSRILPQTKNMFEGSTETINDTLFHRGFTAALTGDTTVFNQNAAQDYATTRREAAVKARNEALIRENQAWLAENAQKEGVQTTASGLQYKVLTQGTGDIPTSTDEVVVKYEGHLIDGTEFDSSYKRNPQTTTFRANQVIKGWTEALTMMPVGSKWELYIPQELAYGDRQQGKIKPYSTLIFTVELTDIKKPAATKAEQTAAPAKPAGTAKPVRPAKKK